MNLLWNSSRSGHRFVKSQQATTHDRCAERPKWEPNSTTGLAGEKPATFASLSRKIFSPRLFAVEHRRDEVYIFSRARLMRTQGGSLWDLSHGLWSD